MIQDAAAKCRFCGEWLDPTKRPDWAQSGATAAPAQAPAPAPSAASPAAAPTPFPAPRPRRDLDPAATTTDGSVHRPRRRGTQTWSAPAWMAKDDARTAPAPSAPEPAASAPEPADAAPEPAPKAERPVPPEIDALLDSGPPAVAEPPQPKPEPPTRPPVELIAAPAPAPEPVEQTIDDVAERMKRIRASAAAVREAMLAESADLQPSVLSDDDVESALTIQGEAPTNDDPPPSPPPDVASMLGDDFDDFDDDDDDDDEFDPAPMPATRREARSEPDLDDDAMPATGALADFDFGDDDFDDDDDDGDFDFGDVGASRPIPWKPVALGVGLALVIGLGFSWNRLFGSETLEEEDPAAEADDAGEEQAPEEGQVAQGSVAPAPTPTPAPGQGQPVVPEGQAPAAVGTPGAPAAQPGAVPPGTPAEAEAVAADATPAAPAAPVPADAIATLDEARSLYQKGGKRRLTEAKEKLQGILDAAPNSADALLLMAQVELELGEMEASLATATKCTTVAPQTADCWLSIGVLKQNAKEDEAAIAAFERYLALAPEGAYASQVKKQLARLQ